MIEDYKLIETLCQEDVEILREKGETYGNSWRKRGGVGAYMMLARKIDRIENICKANGWNVFQAIVENKGDLLDDIRDLRRYLLLVDAYVVLHGKEADMTSYVNPDFDQLGA